jgi:(4S)-4-hydroxy-5-phosphonooxypentane-2,3-dione isomerase
MAYVVVVDLTLDGQQRAAFMPLMLANAAASLADEPGCRQFDVCVSPQDADSVLLYEIYDSAAAFEAHLQTPHFLSFDQSTASMVVHKAVRRFVLQDLLPPAA